MALGMALLPAHALASTHPSVTVPSALIMTMDGRIMWSRHSTDSRRVASTIKMLNALVVREHASLDETVTVTRKAARTPDGVGLRRGQKFTVRQLLKFTLVASANDAAEALAIHIGGTEANYVAMMNAKAKSLGLTRTHAVDPHGLSKREHSTARDLSVIARQVLKDPVLRKIILLKKVRVRRPGGAYVTARATNRLLGHYVGIEGVKTGFTNPAGYCLVSAAKRRPYELVGVVLGARTLDGRFSQTRKLLDWGFAHVRWRRLVAAGAVCGSATVASGTVPTVAVYAAREASAVVITVGSKVATVAVIPKQIRAPIRRGQQLGVLRISQRGVVLASVALLARSDVVTASAPSTGPAAPACAGAQAPVQPSIGTGGLLGHLWDVLAADSELTAPVTRRVTLGVSSPL